MMGLTMAEALKRRLSLAEAVDAGRFLFEINSAEEGVLALMRQAGLACDAPEERARLLEEWRAYVHASVLAAFMECAPNAVWLEYERATQPMLRRLGYGKEQGEAFVDGPLKAYAELLFSGRAKECPALFFLRAAGKQMRDMPPRCAAVLAGAMAMLLSALIDRLEQYDYALE